MHGTDISGSATFVGAVRSPLRRATGDSRGVRDGMYLFFSFSLHHSLRFCFPGCAQAQTKWFTAFDLSKHPDIYYVLERFSYHLFQVFNPLRCSPHSFALPFDLEQNLCPHVPFHFNPSQKKHLSDAVRHPAREVSAG